MPETFDAQRGRRMLRIWWLRQIYHRAEIIGAHHIPRDGGALFVGNHGRLDFDGFILIRLILRETGRFTRSLADRFWFKSRLTAAVAHAFGAVEGNRDNAQSLLRAGELVLTYPGGVPEIMNTRFGQESIRWEGRYGFARVAILSQVPVIPVAGIGINNGFLFLTKGEILGKIIYQRVFRMGASHSNYRDPLVIGLIPLPLPFSTAVHFPLPCKVRYFFGNPIEPPEIDNGSNLETLAGDFSSRVAQSMTELIAESRSMLNS
jgi:1-acyl-sn-glycerol-3-phosphate acyltransferase